MVRNQRRHSSVPMLLVVALGLAVSALFGLGAQRADRQAREARAWTRAVLDSLSRNVTAPEPPPGPEGRDSVYWQWVATSAQMQTRRSQQAVRYWTSKHATLLDEADIVELKRQGLENPVEQLRDSLMAHPGLIPYQGTGGGKMRFVSGAPGEAGAAIVLLGPPYAFAYFEDGHVGGHMLLEYRVLPEQRIRWRVLWSALD